jgi:hypothetical protein
MIAAMLVDHADRQPGLAVLLQQKPPRHPQPLRGVVVSWRGTWTSDSRRPGLAAFGKCS